MKKRLAVLCMIILFCSACTPQPDDLAELSEAGAQEIKSAEPKDGESGTEEPETERKQEAAGGFV